MFLNENQLDEWIWRITFFLSDAIIKAANTSYIICVSATVYNHIIAPLQDGLLLLLMNPYLQHVWSGLPSICWYENSICIWKAFRRCELACVWSFPTPICLDIHKWSRFWSKRRGLSPFSEIVPIELKSFSNNKKLIFMENWLTNLNFLLVVRAFNSFLLSEVSLLEWLSAVIRSSRYKSVQSVSRIRHFSTSSLSAIFSHSERWWFLKS